MASRTVKAENAETDSDCSSQETDMELDSVRSLSVAFKHFMWPLLISIMGELAFCWCMGVWSKSAEAHGMEMPGDVEDYYKLTQIYWSVFISFLLLRFLLVLMWKFTGNKLSDSFYGGWYLFCSTFQWVIYMGVYYKMSEELTGMVWEDTVMLKNNATHNHLETSALFKCLDVNGTLGCRHHVSRAIVCAEVYTPYNCSGFSDIGVGDDMVRCCVKAKYSLSQPVQRLAGTPFRIVAIFSVLQWMAVLSMKWVLELNPLLPSMGSYQFVGGAVVDIFDSIVFAAYLVKDRVLFPRYGISYDVSNRGGAAEEDSTAYHYLCATWAVAISLSVLSPVVYTLLRRTDRDTADPSERTFEKALADLVSSLRMLRGERSHDLVDEALALQLSQYVDEAEGHGEEHAVRVLDEGSEDEDEDEESGESNAVFVAKKAINLLHDHKKEEGRPAMARHVGGPRYFVRYLDGFEPSGEVVSVCRLVADVSGGDTHSCGNGCIKGWCMGPQSTHDRFDNWAEIIDAYRSLFTLELPFFLWRFWFEYESLKLDSFTIIVLAKNFVWGLHDLLVILSCGNTSATIFGRQPLAAMSYIIKGSAMSSVWVGPAGFFRIAADFTAAKTKAGLQKKEDMMETHKAWLTLEREKLSRKTADSQELDDFDKAIERVSSRIADVERKMAAAHT